MSIPFEHFLGMATVGDGADTYVLRAAERHIGDHRRRSLHGGALTAFCEHAALGCLEADGEPAEAVTITCRFVREAEVVDTIAEVEVIRRGRRFADAAVRVWQHSPDQVVAHAVVMCRLTPTSFEPG